MPLSAHNYPDTRSWEESLRQFPKTYVIGILNITPDSFSDGGKFINPDDALRKAKVCWQQIVDVQLCVCFLFIIVLRCVVLHCNVTQIMLYCIVYCIVYIVCIVKIVCIVCIVLLCVL